MPTIWVLAGTNGAGKSSIGGAMLRQGGGDYFNPDEAAAVIRQRDPSLSQEAANALGWRLGVRQLDRAIAAGTDYFFETTLGGRTITARLSEALARGHEVRIWYVGLSSPEMHITRVAARVRDGGHDIPEDAIRRRFEHSRRNLVQLLPQLTELKVYDNSQQADPATGDRPTPMLVLHWQGGRLLAPRDVSTTPAWAKPIVAQALKCSSDR
jgi:predicted ABC-type ATPase